MNKIGTIGKSASHDFVINGELLVQGVKMSLFSKKELSEEEERLYMEFIDRRAKREPVAYIMGSWDFMGLSFKVNRDVLIPEQDSEFLVEEALRHCSDGMRILDLCTGSGCIAIILKKSLDCNVLAVDVSKKALKIAQKNAKLHSTAINFIKSNMFGGINKKFDIIVSNPPLSIQEC